jgi:D-amino-acid dehydrogenase
MSKKVLIVGGGIIGICSAYFLKKEGFDVTIVDKSGMNAGASYINAGYLSPGHIIPLASPGVISQGLKWMFDSSSPFYIQPRLNTAFVKWLYAFNKSCTEKNVKNSIKPIIDLSVFSQKLLDQIKSENQMSFHYEKKGLMMLCKSEKHLKKEEEVVKRAVESGLSAKMLSPQDIKLIEPNIKIDTIGAAYFKSDHHTTPGELILELKKFITENGVKCLKNTEIESFDIDRDRIKSVTVSGKSVKFDEYVLSAGTWTSEICKKLGFELLLQAGKGYSINHHKETGLTCPAILVEAKCAVTPMNGFSRFSGTMEISSINNKLRMNRVNAIADSVESFYPSIKISETEKNNAGFGFRPISADGLPYIGRINKLKNVTIATGHGMMGWSMSTGTGKIISEIISDKKTSIDIDRFNPNRKF